MEGNMQKAKTRTYDASEYLKTEKDMSAYFEAALEEGDPALVVQSPRRNRQSPRHD
jgi:DNA-binding phage protein